MNKLVRTFKHFLSFLKTPKELKRILKSFLFFVLWSLLTMAYGNPLQVLSSVQGIARVLFYAIMLTLIISVSDYGYRFGNHSDTDEITGQDSRHLMFPGALVSFLKQHVTISLVQEVPQERDECNKQMIHDIWSREIFKANGES
ncbi:MAG: hypothetical protein LKJ47_02555 [Bifidobacteriaceae bacterium]|jgi:hypothetical protein|nr:hypothetical protein [Bifidobacteriaceae bacterium]